jgi:hypothetical protein
MNKNKIKGREEKAENNKKKRSKNKKRKNRKNSGVWSHRYIILAPKYCWKDQRSCDARGEGKGPHIS